MKKIIFTIPAQADVRRIDRETAMRILTALHRFAETGEGDVKLQGESGELRLRVGEYRVRPFFALLPCSSLTPRTLTNVNRKLLCSSHLGVTCHPYSRCRRQRQVFTVPDTEQQP